MKGTEKRKNPRRSVYARVVVRYQTPGGQAVEMNGTMEDSSESGLGIYLERALELRAPVTVIQNSGNRVGIVRRCVRTNAGYFVGIEL